VLPAVHTPLPYEATPGIVAGVAPAGATHVQVEAPGVRARFRLPRGRAAFRVGPTGLPARDLTLTVRFLRAGRTVALRRVPHLYGLPARAAAFRPPTVTDAAAARLLRGSSSEAVPCPASGPGTWPPGAPRPGTPRPASPPPAR
jgi:hypothetical protein